MTTTTACPFVWYELMTTDAEAAARFYSRVVGWQTADAGMPGPAYTLLKAGDVVVGGLMAQPADVAQAGAPPAWVGYIGVPDVDAAVASITAAGGQQHRPAEDIPGVGRFAVMADPHGAVFVVFKDHSAPGAAPPAPAAADAPGAIGWHELMAGDLDSAWSFYSAQFGWRKDTVMDMGPMGTYLLFAAGGEAIGGMMTRPAEVPVPFWLYYVNVEAIDAAAARVGAEGGRVLNGPMEVPGGSWIVQAMDPQGAVFALVAPRR